MAEYGLYGAMVRHSLPLPETIMRQQQTNTNNNTNNNHQPRQSEQSGRNSSSTDDNEPNGSSAAGSSQHAPEKLQETAQTSEQCQQQQSEQHEQSMDADSTAPWLLGMYKKNHECKARPSTGGQQGGQLDKKRELSSIFMSVKRILACGQPEMESSEQPKDSETISSPASNIYQTGRDSTCEPQQQHRKRQNRAQLIKKSRHEKQQHHQQRYQHKKRLSKAAAQKLAEMRQQQLTADSASAQLSNPISDNHSNNYSTPAEAFARHSCTQPLTAPQSYFEGQANLSAFQQPPIILPTPAQAGACLHQLWYPTQHSQLNQTRASNLFSTASNMFVGSQQEQQRAAGFSNSSSQLQHLISASSGYPTGASSEQVIKTLLESQQQFESHNKQRAEQAQQLLMAAAAASLGGHSQNQSSTLWLNEWMQRYMLTQSAMLAAQHQQSRQRVSDATVEQHQQQQQFQVQVQEQQSKLQSARRRKNNFKDVANLIGELAVDDEADIDVVRPVQVSSSRSSESRAGSVNSSISGRDSRDSHKQDRSEESTTTKQLDEEQESPIRAANIHPVN